MELAAKGYVECIELWRVLSTNEACQDRITRSRLPSVGRTPVPKLQRPVRRSLPCSKLCVTGLRRATSRPEMTEKNNSPFDFFSQREGHQQSPRARFRSITELCRLRLSPSSPSALDASDFSRASSSVGKSVNRALPRAWRLGHGRGRGLRRLPAPSLRRVPGQAAGREAPRRKEKHAK